MFHHGAGGYAFQGTLCGSLGACTAFINVVAYDEEKKTHIKLAMDLIAWYTQQNFPLKKFDDVAEYKDQIQVLADSPLCHSTVSKWMMAAGASYNDKNRKDRCAKVAAATVYRTVELLNVHMEGTFKAMGPNFSESTEKCLGCHGPQGSNNQMGQLSCTSCHDDHTL